MNALLKIFILFTLGASGCTQGMSYQDIKERNAKLLAEDEKKFGHENLEAQVPVKQDCAIRRKPCSLNLRQLALPLSCFLFLAACAAGGTYCKQTKNCLYDSNSDASSNNTTDASTYNAVHFQPHAYSVMGQKNNTPIGYTKTKKYMLHAMKNRRGRTKKR